jgi:histidine ammonia-lyase
VTETIVLRSLSDMTLANAERLAFDQAGLALSDEAKSLIDRGRARFEAYLNGNAGYVYGSTTAPGSRAKLVLSEDAVRAQGATLRNFVASRAGPGGKLLPERCVRLALFARLSNSMTGCGKLRAGTVQAIVDMVRAPPPVPLQAVACSGEVLPLTWLMAPIADLPLNTGEAMALVNGSPFATAMVCDVALTARRRVETAERIFALGMEAIGCPAGHVDPRLADHWPDPFYGESLRRLQSLLAGSMRKPLNHQAPTSWRVLPNVLASALQALAEASRSTEIGLQSLKDNPTFLCAGEDRGPDVVVSSGGYHDHRAAKSIDQVNSALLDLCVLASRQVTHMLDGSLGKPALLARADDGVGAEYLAWVMTEPLAAARRAAEATTLDLSVQDPAGNQSDIASLGFIAYAKHRILARAVDTCMASLAMTVALALEFHDATPPRALRSLAERLGAIGRSGERRIDAVGEPLRRLTAILRTSAEEMTSEERTTFFAV